MLDVYRIDYMCWIVDRMRSGCACSVLYVLSNNTLVPIVKLLHISITMYHNTLLFFLDSRMGCISLIFILTLN